MSRKYLFIFGVIIAMGFMGAGCEKKEKPAAVAPVMNAPYAEGEAQKMTNETVVPSVAQEKQTPSEPVTQELPIKNNMHLITLSTNYGDIQFSTYNADAPKTVQNFITLAQKGFYDKVIFHRVIKGFMIQGGDPTGTGMGGPGYKFEDELNPATESYKQGYKKGVVAMANAGPNTNGSQFFIMHQDNPLPNSYSIFGKVVKGQDVVDAIANVATGANDKPMKPVEITSVKVEEVK